MGKDQEMATQSLTEVKDVGEFFYKELLQSIEALQLALSKDIEFYLVHLLSNFHRKEQCHQFDSDEPLAVCLLKAPHLPREERRIQLKWLGDFTLFMAGYFAESFNRKLVGSDYYTKLGTQAYYSLADMGYQGAETYYSLAENFLTCTDLLNEVAASTRGETLDLLHLYEEWLNRESRFARRGLSEQGIIPIDVSQKSKLYEQ